MSYALATNTLNIPSDRLSQLIVVDIAPSIGKLSSDFISYVSAMREIEALPPGVIKTRTDADNILKAYEPVCFLTLVARLSFDINARIFPFANSFLPIYNFQVTCGRQATTTECPKKRSS